MSLCLYTPQWAMVLLFCLTVSSTAGAEPPPPPAERTIALETCLEMALAGNPALQAAALRAEAARKRSGQSRAIPNPQFTAEVENFGGRGEFTGWEAAESTFALSQEIELGGKRAARTAETAAQAGEAEAEYESRRRDLTRDTRQAFIELLLAQENFRLARDAARLAEEVEQTTVRRVAAGKTSPLESDRVRVETARAEMAVADAEQEFASARRALAALWGADGTAFDAAGGGLEDNLAEVAPLESLLAGIGRAPEIARAEAAIASARGRLRGERAERVPNVEIFAGWRRFQDTGDSALLAGIGLSLPVFNRNTDGIRAAAADLEAARIEESAVRADLSLQLRRLHARLRNHRERARSLHRLGLPAAEQALAAAQAGYREGKFGYLEILDTQRVYTELRGEYAQALAEYHNTRADLDRLTETPL